MKTYLHKLGMTLALTLVSVVGWGQSYTVGFPNYSNLTETSVQINVSIDNPLSDPSSYRVRCIALLSLATAPTLSQVNGFKDAANITIVANKRGTVSLDEFTTSGIITSITGLTAGTSYTVYLVTYDLSELTFLESQPTAISFTTPVAPAPLSIVSYTPTPGTQTAPIADNISITFSENIALGTSGYLSIYKTGNGTFDDFNFSSTKLSINGATLTINPDPDFDYSTTYDVLMNAGIVVSAATGVPCPAITDHSQWQFKTVDPPAPVITLDPVNEATAIELQPTIKIMFDQPVRFTNGTTITNLNVESLIANFYSDEETSHIITASDYVASINATKDTITLNLSATLHESVKYTIAIAPVENLIGQEQINPTTSVFYTETFIKWLGGTSDWGTASNWSSNSVPTSAQSVRIEKAGSEDPVINSARTVRHIIINPDAALIIASSGNLTVGKKLYMLSSQAQNASLLIDGAINYNPTNISIYQGITQEAWRYFISSPVVGATQSNTGAGIIGIKEYDSTVPAWKLISNTTPMTVGKGYAATGISGSSMIFRGTINNNDSYTFSAIRTIVPKNNYGWNLAGNPYPCAIDWDLITKNNMTDGFWMWLNDSQKYGTYNGVSGLGANLSLESPSIIPSGHSFWSQVLLPNPNTTNTSGSIIIPKAARTSNTPSYLKAANSDVNKAVLRLVGFNGTTEDEIVTALIEGASDSFDPFDSEKQFSLNGDLVQLYSLAGNTKCAINSFDMTAFNGDMVIPIGFKAINASNNESFGIGLKSVSGLPDDIVIELEDTQNSTKKVLTALSHYCFSSVGNVDDPNRFKLHLKSASTSTSISNSPINNSGITVSAGDHSIIIDIPSVESSSYQLTDINGQLLSSGALYFEKGNRITVNKTGFIIVKVISANEIFTSKILIK